MGSQQMLCQQQGNGEQSFLQRQVNFYKWRSDPNCNTFIARTSFKNAYQHHQEQQFQVFLQQQDQKEYLQIFKFKENGKKEERKDSEEIIMFEKYLGTLKQFQGKLYIDEAIYTFYSLLFGFQEIKRYYEELVVESRCCFVASDGGVRAWINSNCKSNKVWTISGDQITVYSKNREILLKIIELSQSLSLKHAKTDELFRILRTHIYKPTFKNLSFNNFRQIINEFCYINNITMSNNLLNAVQRNKNQHNAMSIKHHSSYCKTLPNQTENSCMLKSSTMERQRITYAPLVRSKSIGLQKFIFSDKFQNHDQIHESKIIRPSFSKSPSQMASTIQNNYDMARNNKFQVNSNIIHFNNHNHNHNEQANTRLTNLNVRSTIIEGNNPKEKINEMMHSQNATNNHLIHAKKTDFSQDGGFMLNAKKKLQERCIKQTASEVSFKSSLKDHHLKFSDDSDDLKKYLYNVQNNRNQREKDNITVSIINNIPKLKNQEVSHHYNDSQSQSYEGKEIMAEQRPWITTKTITRLISQNQDEQMNKSVGESSEEYYNNNSDYSGALSMMGRNIVSLDCKKHKTVRVSRQY